MGVTSKGNLHVRERAAISYVVHSMYVCATISVTESTATTASKPGSHAQYTTCQLLLDAQELVNSGCHARRVFVHVHQCVVQCGVPVAIADGDVRAVICDVAQHVKQGGQRCCSLDAPRSVDTLT